MAIRKHIRSRIFLALPSALIAFEAADALELGGVQISAQPRIETGAQYYRFSQDAEVTSNGVALSGATVSAVLPFIGGGLTLFADRFFLDVSGQHAFTGNDDFSQTELFFNEDQVIQEQGTSDFYRNEIAVSLGHGVAANTALYVGYKRAEVSFKDTATSTAQNPFFSTTLERKNDYTQNGFFLGGVQGWSIAENSPFGGLLTFNVAVAYLEGKIKSNTSETLVEPAGFTFSESDSATRVVDGQFEGDTVGVNLGLSWKAAITKRLNYHLGASGYTYNFSGKDGAADFAETLVRFAAALSYDF